MSASRATTDSARRPMDSLDLDALLSQGMDPAAEWEAFD